MSLISLLGTSMSFMQTYKSLNKIHFGNGKDYFNALYIYKICLDFLKVN